MFVAKKHQRKKEADEWFRIVFFCTRKNKSCMVVHFGMQILCSRMQSPRLQLQNSNSRGEFDVDILMHQFSRIFMDSFKFKAKRVHDNIDMDCCLIEMTRKKRSQIDKWEENKNHRDLFHNDKKEEKGKTVLAGYLMQRIGRRESGCLCKSQN